MILSGDDEEIRRGIWENNVRKINKHNKEYQDGAHGYKMAVNKFTAMVIIIMPKRD